MISFGCLRIKLSSKLPQIYNFCQNCQNAYLLRQGNVIKIAKIIRLAIDATFREPERHLKTKQLHNWGDCFNLKIKLFSNYILPRNSLNIVCFIYPYYSLISLIAKYLYRSSVEIIVLITCFKVITYIIHIKLII